MKTIGLYGNDAAVLAEILTQSTHPRAADFLNRIYCATSFYVGDEAACHLDHSKQSNTCPGWSLIDNGSLPSGVKPIPQ